MANLFCYLWILIVKTAINQTFNQQQLPIAFLILMASSKFHTVYDDFNHLHCVVFLVNSRGPRFSATVISI
jgi:transcriptional regulator of acetoin/glycerol metabolism